MTRPLMVHRSTFVSKDDDRKECNMKSSEEKNQSWKLETGDPVCGETVTLTFDGDEEVNCSVIAIFEAGKEYKEYIALLAEKDASEVYFYRYYCGAEGEKFSFGNIEDDEEFEIVSKEFDKLMDSMALGSL